MINYGLGHLVQASSDLDKAIALNPSEPESYFFRSEIRRISGESELALQDYAKAEELKFKLPPFSTIKISCNYKEAMPAAAKTRSAS